MKLFPEHGGMDRMQITLWGVRGSLPISSPDTVRYGGNTTCIGITCSHQELLIIDGGSGLYELGKNLPDQGTCTLCLSHLHWDHIQGLPFFQPFYSSDWTVHLYVPHGGERVLDTLMDGLHFPLFRRELAAKIEVRTLKSETELEAGSLRVKAFAVPHTGLCLGFRIEEGATEPASFSGDETLLLPKTLAISSDCEIAPGQSLTPILRALFRDVEVALVDANYTLEEYLVSYRGWGHSAQEVWLPVVADMGIQQLILSHHDVRRTDGDLDNAQHRLREALKGLPCRLDMAYEGMRLYRRVGKGEPR